MAAAALSHLGAHRILGNKRLGRSAPHDDAQQEREKAFIAEFEECKRPLSPKHIAEDPRNKKLGASSKQLRLKDFDLVKTLGTGTFARVWLARLANSSKQDREKVFALKILRKVDSKHPGHPRAFDAIATDSRSDIVVKLKQVEHVRNERNTLAAVAGHPFITTMITSFSDHDCLYMLVSILAPLEVRILADWSSWTTALAARSSHIYDEHGASMNRPHDSTPQRLSSYWNSYMMSRVWHTAT